MKVSTNSLYHMTEMAAMPIYAHKLSKSSSLEKRTADELETWYIYAASSTPK